MLFIVNCLNIFMEKCDSRRLRVIVEAAQLVRPSRLIVWSNPTQESIGKKEIEKMKESDLFVYPEIARLNLPISHITSLDKLPREFYEETSRAKEVFLIGCNVEGWLVKIAIEMWNVYRIRPSIIIDGWFTIGNRGAHGNALNELTRHFGASCFKDWEVMRAPILKMRKELADSLLASEKKEISSK